MLQRVEGPRFRVRIGWCPSTIRPQLFVSGAATFPLYFLMALYFPDPDWLKVEPMSVKLSRWKIAPPLNIVLGFAASRRARVHHPYGQD
jgi:hypothetical protein